MGGLLSLFEPSPPPPPRPSSNYSSQRPNYNYRYETQAPITNQVYPNSATTTTVNHTGIKQFGGFVEATPNHSRSFQYRSNYQSYNDQTVIRCLTQQIRLEYPWWSIMSDNELFSEELPSYNADYAEIHTLFIRPFRNTASVSQIQKIQNQFLMSRYILKMEEYKAKKIPFTEKLLFHGTKLENVASICLDNFDWRKVRKSKFGHGVSFSPKSTYALHYCTRNRRENKVMLVAKVLIGRSCSGESGMTLPGNLCDTTTNEDKSVIVKYNDDEFYPAFLIHFSAEIMYPNRETNRY